MTNLRPMDTATAVEPAPADALREAMISELHELKALRTPQVEPRDMPSPGICSSPRWCP